MLCLSFSHPLAHLSPTTPLALPALALIPDDDDFDLVVKARANRSARLSSEKTTEARFSAEGGAAKKVGPLAAAQKAVRKLSRSAAALDAGSVSDAAAALSGFNVGGRYLVVLFHSASRAVPV